MLNGPPRGIDTRQYIGNSAIKGEHLMPQTVEAIYHDGVVELKEKPTGIQKARALVIFLDPEEPKNTIG